VHIALKGIKLSYVWTGLGSRILIYILRPATALRVQNQKNWYSFSHKVSPTHLCASDLRLSQHPYPKLTSGWGGAVKYIEGEGIINYRGCMSCQFDFGFFCDMAALIKVFVLLNFLSIMCFDSLGGV
jgi:hypothetical protein